MTREHKESKCVSGGALHHRREFLDFEKILRIFSKSTNLAHLTQLLRWIGNGIMGDEKCHPSFKWAGRSFRSNLDFREAGKPSSIFFHEFGHRILFSFQYLQAQQLGDRQLRPKSALFMLVEHDFQGVNLALVRMQPALLCPNECVEFGVADVPTRLVNLGDIVLDQLAAKRGAHRALCEPLEVKVASCASSWQPAAKSRLAAAVPALPASV